MAKSDSRSVGQSKLDQLIADPAAFSVAARERADEVAERDVKRALARKRAKLRLRDA